MKGQATRTLVLAGVALGGAVGFLLPVVMRPAAVPFWRGADYTDLLVAHLPSAVFLNHALRIWREIPLWNPTILSGIPFAADPLSGLWYPPLWLAALAPFPLTFNILTLLHIAWAGIGMGLFLRRLGLSLGPALIGALAFAGTPKLIGHVALGHVSLVYAVSWTPWLLLSAESLADSLASTRPDVLRKAATAGAALGLIFLTDPRWVMPSGLLASIYVAARWLSAPEGGRGARWVIAASIVGATALGTSAGLSLPLLEWLQLTTRAGSLSTVDSMALPPANLIGLLVPQYGGWPEWMVSVGTAVVFLAAIALFARTKGIIFWVFVAVAGWLLALGEATPLGLGLGGLPGFDLLRVPPRWLFVSALAMAVLSAVGAGAVLRSTPDPTATRRLRLGAFGASAAVVAVGLGAYLLQPGSSPTLGLIAGGAVALLAFVLVSLQSRLAPRLAAGLWIGLVIVDLSFLDASLLVMRTEDDDKACAADSMASELATVQRVFSPSYAIPQDKAARHGIELADGVHPLQLRAYVDWMADATGFEAAGYSVTLPPFPTGDPKLDWGPKIDAEALGMLAVDLIVTDYPVSAEGLRDPQSVGGLLVYANSAARPRAWLETSASGEWREVDGIARSPNRIVVEVEGPGRLVLSEVAYPGWTADLDGAAIDIELEDGLFRAVDVPAGEHTARFEFRPTSLYAGLALTIVSLGCLAFLWSRRA
jgi:hypothetical protein